MASKALLLLGLFAFIFVLSEVAAASEMQSGTVKSETEKTVLPEQYNGGNGGRGGYNGRGPYHGGGSYKGGGRGGAGGVGYDGGVPIKDGCRHGCCYGGRGGCLKCCSFAGEAVQTQSGH